MIELNSDPRNFPIIQVNYLSFTQEYEKNASWGEFDNVREGNAESQVFKDEEALLPL